MARARTAHFLDGLPRAVAAVKNDLWTQTAGHANGRLGRLQTSANDIEKTIAQTPSGAGQWARVVDVEPSFDARQYVLPASAAAGAAGVRIAAVALLTFLLLVTGDLYKRKLVELTGPRRADRRLTADVIRMIDRQIERFLIVRVLIS